MMFNSIDFAVFFTVVLGIYFLLRHTAQNRLLLIASYVFYGFWDWRYVALIFWVANLDYFCALAISKARDRSQARRWVALSLGSNFALLAYFKYWNFFLDSVSGLAATLGHATSFMHWEIVLPVGISFFVFQSTAYVLEVYRGTVPACRSYPDYLLFGAFFPQLVAGPIERPERLLRNILEPRQTTPEGVFSGLVEIAWGLFKKIAVADHLAVYVDAVYRSHSQHSGLTLGAATVLFAFQIYCDFSAYSDMARGMARIMGFDLMVNFDKPYLSRDLGEFWRRWHISLSTWFRDYLYVPLGGNRVDPVRGMVNVMLVFVVSGLWHGANWTFVVWGALHGAGLVVHRRWARRGEAALRWLPAPLATFCATLLTFAFVCLAWIFFRADSVQSAFSIISRMVSAGGPLWINQGLGFGLLPLLVLLSAELWSGRDSVPRWFQRLAPHGQAIALAAFVLFSWLCASKSGAQFIYFQF